MLLIYTGLSPLGQGEVNETILRHHFLAKYNQDGFLISAGEIDFKCDCFSNFDPVDLVDNAGNVYVVGLFFTPPVTFGSGKGTEITLTKSKDLHRQNSEFFLAKYQHIPDLITPVTGTSVTVEKRISSFADDAEEFAATGLVSLNSDRIVMVDGRRDDLVTRKPKNRLVGLRFTALGIPNGATITRAYVQFQANQENKSDTTIVTDLTITGELTGNSTPFNTENYNISSRIQTDATVNWIPEPWDRVGASGNEQKTSSIIPIVQEIIDQPGWSPGNSLVVMISGKGEHDAESYDGMLAAAPLLHITYVAGSGKGDSALEDPLSPVDTVVVVDAQITAGSDDAEEKTESGSVNLVSKDLELGESHYKSRLVGMRFTNLKIPYQAIITRAYLQFQVNDRSSRPVTLNIAGEAIDDAPTFTASKANISSRIKTRAVVEWVPRPWIIRGTAGPDQQSPNVAGIIQEIVNRPGWSSGNALAFIITGNGERTSESFEGNSSAAPSLHVEFSTATVSPALDVDAGLDQVVVLPNGISLNGNIHINGLLNPPGIKTTWRQVSGSGTVKFSDPLAIKTTASFDREGIYVLELTAIDDSVTSTDTVTISVYPVLAFEWAINPLGKRSQVFDMTSDDSGNIYHIGRFSKTQIFGLGTSAETILTSFGKNDIFMAKYEADGDFAWVKRAGGEFGDAGLSITTDRSDNLYVLSRFDRNITFGSGEIGEITLTSKRANFALAKYTTDGDVLWAIRIGSETGLKPSSLEYGGIISDDSGNIYLTGYSPKLGAIGSNETKETKLFFGRDPYAAKYTTDGKLIWAKSLYSPGNRIFSAITLDKSGNVYIAGSVFNSVGNATSGYPVSFGEGEVELTFHPKKPELYMAKYAGSNGKLIWAKYVARNHPKHKLSISDIAVNSSGNIFIGGFFERTASIGSRQTTEIKLKSEGHFDSFVAKYTTDGKVVWGRSAGGTGYDINKHIAIDQSGNLYTSGFFEEELNFKLEEGGEVLLSSHEENDQFISKYTTEGKLVTARSIGGIGGKQGIGEGGICCVRQFMSVDLFDNIIVLGEFQGSDTFGRNEVNETILTSDGRNDLFLAKYKGSFASSNPPVKRSVTVEARVLRSADDVEEVITTGHVNIDSVDLELGTDGERNQFVGLRFDGLIIPRGAMVTNAYIQFQAKKMSSGAARFLIYDIAANDASFANSDRTISSRQTSKIVEWNPPQWVKGDAGGNQQTPNIASLIQKHVGKDSDWIIGSTLTFRIEGDGKRIAESYDGNPVAAPLLLIEYELQ